MLDRITWRIGFIAAAIVAALLFVGFATQTIRIEGFNLWPLKLEGFKAANERLTLDLDRIKEQTELADAKAKQAKLEAEADYRRKAEETDREFQADLADARARADRYARLNRVRTQAAPGAPGQPAPSPDRDGAEGSDGPGEGSGLVITREDFDTLTENTLRLQKAREWACSLEGAKCD